MTDGQVFDAILAGEVASPFEHIERTPTGYLVIIGASKWNLATDAQGNITRQRLDRADLEDGLRYAARKRS